MKAKHIQHLYNRVGFGITPKELARLSNKNKREIIDEVFKNSAKITPLKADLSFLKDIKPGDLRIKGKRQELQKISRKKIQKFSISWMERILNPTEVFREKMTLFWANHFVSESRNNILFTQNYNNLLRENAFGNFRDFTKKISKDASMLGYLNNKQNRKKSPNENFARELMELFTLGQGNYTETDIKESARAFTGYSHNFRGKFVMRKWHHDENEKTFFNKTGNFNGDDIIDIILEQQQCARFISEKIYRFFVNENINKEHVAAMTAVFYKDYDIEKLMRFILLSDWFYDDENIGTKIKSPMEFLAGIHQVIPYQFERPKQALLMQRLLGQTLLRPPNVAGWKTGRNWIDSNTMVRRLRLASILLNNAAITYSDTGDEETMLTDLTTKKLKRKTFIRTKTDWNAFEKNYKKIDNKGMISLIISSQINKGTAQMLSENLDIPKKDFCVQLMSIPEYQLC